MESRVQFTRRGELDKGVASTRGHSRSDLYFVPDHGRQIAWAGHHDTIHAQCADEGRILELVRHMDGAGYALPTEPPDATFKWPAWMPQGPAESEGSRDLCS
jgi:hypothetical protein